MRKLSKIDSNSFAPDLIEIILPERLDLENLLKENPQIDFEAEVLPHLTHLFIVMSCSDSDLKKLMKDPKLQISEDKLLTIMYNSLCSLNFLHQSNVIHRDIKPANFLIELNNDVKICDFGLSRTMPKKNEHQSELKKLKKSSKIQRVNKFKEDISQLLVKQHSQKK